MPADELSSETYLDLLGRGKVEVLGRIPWGSNATLLADVYDLDAASNDDAEPVLRAVYKPRRGEQPLWDFPDGLDRREVAAYELSKALGWGIVPETVLREDLPFGVGSLQRFVPFAPDEHYFTLLEDPAHHDALRTICCFDLVTNQADRKGGHCLLDEGKQIWAVDNALSFHWDLKLRTVIWDFAGESVPDRLRQDLAQLENDGLPEGLRDLIDDAEQAALLKRVRMVGRMDAFPADTTGRRYPWPVI